MIPDILIPTYKTELEVSPMVCELQGFAIENRVIVTGLQASASVNRNAALDKATSEIVIMCFKKGTLVELESCAKEIQDVCVGDKVRTHTGKHQRVLCVFKRQIAQNKPIVWMKTTHSLTKCTPEHPYYVYRDGSLQWVAAGGLFVNDCLVYPINTKPDTIVFDCHDKQKRHVWSKYLVTPDFARFMGLYLAQGCGASDGIRLTVNNNNKEQIGFLKNFFSQTFNREPTIHKRWATTIKLNIRIFSSKFTFWFGKDAKSKKVPDFVFGWNTKNKLEFIRGCVSGDGTITGKGRTVSSASKELIHGFVRLCGECGLKTGVIHITPPRTVLLNGRPTTSDVHYYVRIGAASWGKLCDIVDAPIVVGKYAAITVSGIEVKRATSKDNLVYNLEVEGDNSYIANSAIVHNCDDDICGFFPGWWQRLIEPLQDPKVVFVSARLMTLDGNVGAMMFGSSDMSQPLEEVPGAPTAAVAFRNDGTRFHEGFKRSGFEDSYFVQCLKHKYPGGRVVINNEVKLIHINEQKGQGEAFEHNKALYEKLLFENGWRDFI
jgi:hypothetical protein